MKDVDQGCEGEVHCPKKNHIPSQRNVFLMSCTFV